MPGKKAAIELSLNFIVVLVISIVIFGFGVAFISRLYRQAIDIQDMTISELDGRIGQLVCEGSDRVCIGVDRKTIPRTEFKVFALNIINILDPPQGNTQVIFDVKVSPSSPIGYKKDKQVIQPIGSFKGLVVNPVTRDVVMKKNEERSIGIGIQAPADAVSGTYIFNVEIKTLDGKPYSAVQKLYVDVP